MVETVFYVGPRFGWTHFWVGDREGRFADPEGPSASELLWSFFRQHELRAVTTADWRGARQARLEGTGWHTERFQSSVSR